MNKCLEICALALMLASCSQRPAPSEHVETSQSPDPVSRTIWTDKAELFVEYPPLVAGRTSRFAVHLTRLSDFKPLKQGACEVRLERGGTPPEVFHCDAPSRPGIFGVDVQPRASGEARMSIDLQSAGLVDSFDVGAVTIAPDANSIRPSAQDDPEESIAFLKEQQWNLDFGTHVVTEQTVRENLRVSAEIQPRAGGEADVVAPIAGRLTTGRILPVGTVVVKGTELASILPPTNAASDLPALQLAQAEAKVALELTRRDRQRAERLHSAGAAPARRLDEARALETTAEARLRAAEIRLEQYEATRAAEGIEAGAKRFLLRAPIGGIVSEARAVNGAVVESGQVLFRIVDVDSVFVSGFMPEAELPRLRELSGADIEIPGSDQVRSVQRLVSIGRLVDPATRTVPVVYAIDNKDRRFAIRQAVFLRLLLAAAVKAPAVPESALVDDGGRPIVFVQKAGERFVRRPVKVGNRAGGTVHILEGVKAGERVVTKGAYLIRLAAMSSQIPAHGHVH